jgi:hypothetical protein
MKTKFTLGLVGLVGLSACMDLEEEVVSGVTSSYYETASGLEDAVEASYAGLHPLFAQEMDMTMTEMGTDLWTKGADGSHKQWNDYTPTLNPTTSLARNYWNDSYRAINTINAVIDRAANIKEGISEAQKNARIAEVRFLRGLIYFNLVRHYGDVHLSLKETTGVITEAKRSPKAEVYKQIVEDLKFAEANLPAKQNQHGRATKGAAQHILSLVYLTRAEGNDLAVAKEYADKVINSGQYALLPKFSDVFKLGNEKNKEVVFSVQFTTDALTAGGFGNRWNLYYLMEYDIKPGMKRVLEYGRPWKRLRPTEKLIRLWDRDVDTRYEDSFQFVWYAVKNDPKFGLKVGDTAIFIPSVKTSELPAKYKDKNYTIVTEPDNFWNPKPTKFGFEYDPKNFPALSKHQDPTRQSVNDVRGGRDFFVARLADTYLLAAEALIRQGKAAEAVPYINAVRVRAAKPGQAEAMKVTAAQVNLDFVLNERGRELAGEGHRWHDLNRNGKLVEWVKKFNDPAEAGANIQPFHVLRPIPQDQIDRTKNADGAEFTQNPGY